jgi:uncharacterized membrane protein YfcA
LWENGRTLLPELPLVFLIGAAFSAGLVDAVGGGGGLITVPVLLASGLPPHAVLATNKGQACFGAAASLATYVRGNGVDRARLPLGFAGGLLGSLLGVLLVLAVPPAPLRPVMLGLLLTAGAVLLLRRRLARPLPSAHGSRLRLALLSSSVGAYDGFFGPGAGTLLIVGFLHFFGDSPTRASGNAKIVNFGSNLAALLVFQLHGAILWRISVPMGLANVLGASLGAKLALRHGDRVVRAVVITMLLLVVLKVLADLVRR